MSKAALSNENDPTNGPKLDRVARFMRVLEDAPWRCCHLPLYWVHRGRPSQAPSSLGRDKSQMTEGPKA
jgi:hypothetical protein